MIWPALCNGVPFFMADTTNYFRSFDALVYSITQYQTMWSDVIQHTSVDHTQPVSTFHKNIILGRSVYFGALLYPAAFTGMIFIPVIFNALLSGAVIIGITRHFSDPAKDRKRFILFILAAIGIALITPLPYFVSFLMPDIYSGLAILAAVTLFWGWNQETTCWRLFWIAIMILAAVTHSSNILILLSIASVCTVILILQRKQMAIWPIILMVIASITGLASEACFNSALKWQTQKNAIRPPFLSARVIADGPGAAYLKTTCPDNGFALCSNFNNLKKEPYNSDILLWNHDPRKGFFISATSQQQVAISEEQFDFVIAVTKQYPLWVLQTAFGNFADQLTKVGLEDFHGLSYKMQPASHHKIPEPLYTRILNSATERGEMSAAFNAALIAPITLLSLIVLLWAVATQPRLRTPIIIAASGVTINAMVCGILSGPHERYQDRVIWVIPLIATLAILKSYMTAADMRRGPEDC